MGKKGYFIPLALASASALAITACSSSSSTSSAAAPASGTAAASSAASSATAAAGSSPSGAPLVFGVISSDSGYGGNNPDVPTTVSAWQAYVNAHGGIAGHPVQVIVEDDADNAAKALQAAQDLIQNKHAIAIGDSSLSNAAFEKYVDSAKVPVISLNEGDASVQYFTDANFFTNEATVPAGIWAQSKLAKLSGATKYGFLYCSEDPNCASAVPLTKADAASVGIQLAYQASFSASSPNFTAQCVAAQQAGVEALFVAGASQSANQRVLDNCASQHYQPAAIAAVGTLGSATAKDAQIPVQWGYTGTLPWFVQNASTATFHQVMDSYLSKAISPPLVMGTWTGLQLFAAAAKNAGATPSAQDIYDGLYALNGETLGGLTAPLTFKKGQPNQDNCFFVYEVKNGTYSTPQGTSPVCAVGAALEK
jgi:branched-chain amino acid transport system substrate-binding protein